MQSKSSPSRERVLAWTLGVPFFLMPVPLTVDAPDIFGGYGIHLRWALGLMLVGFLVGQLHALGPRLRAPDGWVRRLVPAAWVLGLAALAGVLAMLSSNAGRPLAQLIGGQPFGARSLGPPALPHGLVVLALAMVMGRIAWDRRGPAGLVRIAALVAAVDQGAAWLHANQLTGDRVPLALILALAAVLAGAWPVLRVPSRVGDWLAWGVVFGWLYALALALAVRLMVPVSALPGRLPAWQLALLGALPPALLGTWGVRTLLARLPDGAGVERARVGLVVLARRAPLLVALAVFASVSSSVAVLTGGLLVELFGWLAPESGGRWAPPSLPQPIYPLWGALLLVLGAGVRDRGHLRRLLAGASLGFAALVLGRVAVVTSSPAEAVGAWTGVAAVLVATPLLALIPRGARWGRGVLGLVVLATPVVAGPVVVRYLLAVGLGGAPSLPLCVGLGLALAALTPWLLLRGEDADPIPVTGLAVRLPLLAITLVLPIYITVHAGLRPVTFALTVLALVALLIGTRLPGGPLARLPRLPVGVALWLLFYAGFAQTAVFKLGPSGSQCEAIIEGTSARTLIARHFDGGEYLDAYPYDAVPLPGRSSLLASFKRIDKNGGFVEVIDLGDPSQRARTRVRREGEGGPLWPERLNTDPQTGNALVQVIGVHAHGMWELLPQGPPDAVEPVLIGRKMALDYEPGNPAVDPQRRTLAMTYVPNREGGNPVIEVFDLDSLESRGANHQTGHMMQMADFVETDLGTGRHYAPTLYSFVRFGVIEVSPELALGRHWESFHPVIGLAADPAHGRLYLTNPLAGVMEVLDLESFEVVQRVPVGTFPRDVAFDAQRERLYVANYGDGSVVTFSTEGGRLTEVDRAEVGWLLRGLGVDAGSGRVVAASGCGVFEIGEPE